MSRRLLLIVAVVAFAGIVAAEFELNAAAADHDASDLLYKAASEQPEAVLPQRSLMSTRVSPAKLRPCVLSSTPAFAKYWLTITTFNNRVRNYDQIAFDFADFYLNEWPLLFELPDVTPFQNKPLLKKDRMYSTYRMVIRVYLTPLNAEKCIISARQAAYQAHIFKRARAKISEFKSIKVWRLSVVEAA